MLSYGAAWYLLVDNLKPLYGRQEASAIAHEVLLHLTGFNKLERLSKKEDVLSEEQLVRFEDMRARLLEGEPLQYVRGTEWFRGKEFLVNKHVLIPRPETEELVQWVIDDHKDRTGITILDVGTGSGCIPVSLKLELLQSSVSAIDISGKALIVAKENAAKLGAHVSFKQLDILDPQNWKELGSYSIIVSNPPYIPEAEKAAMDSNVKDFEPGIALFVPDTDAMIFYKQIALLGQAHLKPGGSLYFELHRDRAEEAKNILKEVGYSDIILRKDMHGNDRMLKGIKT